MDTTSISSHSRLMMVRPAGEKQSLAKAPAERSLTTAKADESGATAPPGSAPRAERSESLLEQLKADWGKSDSPWDLNEDGTVNVKDFLQLLARMSSNNKEAESAPEEGSPIDRLLADWGKSDSPWDLNEDGTVDVKDFLNLLARMGSGGDQDAQQNVIEQLKADWGKSDSPWDLNEDGTVNVKDFLKLLAQMGGGGDQDAQQNVIEQLKADWGKSDSPWDLNEDGTVNVKDFLNLLAQMSGGEQPQPQPQPLSPVELLKADWGKSDSPWDLNGDGTVNVQDFLELLARMDERGKEPLASPEEIVQGADPVPQAVDEDAEAEQTLSPLQQLLADWGKSDSRWDLNGDGTVNVRDFLAMLARMGQGPVPQDGPPEPDNPRATHLTRRAVAAYRPPITDHSALLHRGPNFSTVG